MQLQPVANLLILGLRKLLRNALFSIRSEGLDVEIEEAVEAQPTTTTRKLAAELGVSHATIGRHLKRIEKVKKLAKWIPRKK
uniref:Helix-turn-helix type 11 domain-containing protein n=1 Tax=Trichuris muris TaxID=70415 RepID=A0A5S6Q4K7_TRIMR